jgi:hypothetical protein
MRKLNIDKLTWVWQIGALETSSAQVLYYFLSTPNHFFFFFAVFGLELRAYTSSHSTSPIFCDRVFQDRVLQTICLGWLQTEVLLISVS